MLFSCYYLVFINEIYIQLIIIEPVLLIKKLSGNELILQLPVQYSVLFCKDVAIVLILIIDVIIFNIMFLLCYGWLI